MSDTTHTEGVFTAAALQMAVETGAIRLTGETSERQIQPASLDLTLGAKAWRVRASFLPGVGRSVSDCVSGRLFMHELDLGEGAVLERGCVYLVELQERLNLPPDVSAFANPKSSTGRIDVFVRLVTDQGTAFEQVPAGYDGKLYAEISPKTFSIIVRAGSSLNQLRLKRGEILLDDEGLQLRHAETPLVSDTGRIAQGLRLTVQLSGQDGEIIGFRARRHAGLIDVDRIGALDPADYWEPIFARPDPHLILDPDEFYILASKEWLRIPPDLAAEMVAIDPLVGEFRAHYAGFFDPGFGWDEANAAGSRAVLEVRGHDAPFVLEDGQLVARLVYERLCGTPERLYGTDMKSNYQGQGLKLSKHFKPWQG
ncbi:MAG: 2'-deoxycytidine 5'-triphosphate deaminase [Aquisalinus sp.]|nr:2'-deoxycytidine 5'-triphosphate deaminase [Aquisalinus sp.]